MFSFHYLESQAPTLEMLSVRPQADSLKMTWRPLQSTNTVIRGYRVTITNGAAGGAGGSGGSKVDSVVLMGSSNTEFTQYNDIGSFIILNIYFYNWAQISNYSPHFPPGKWRYL